MNRKSHNAFRWGCRTNRPSVSKIRFKADATTCFDVNIEIMTKNCLKSRHYQEIFLKHFAWTSLNADVSTYITKYYRY